MNILIDSLFHKTTVQTIAIICCCSQYKKKLKKNKQNKWTAWKKNKQKKYKEKWENSSRQNFMNKKEIDKQQIK